jgi:hypothetical protein
VKGAFFMNEIMQLISTYGIGVVCVAYLIYFQSTTMKEMLNTLTSINERLTIIENEMKEKEV